MINTKAAQHVLYTKTIAMIQKPGYLLNDQDDQSGNVKIDPLVALELAEPASYDDSSQSSTSYYDSMLVHEKFCMKDTERSDYFKKYIIFNSLWIRKF